MLWTTSTSANTKAGEVAIKRIYEDLFGINFYVSYGIPYKDFCRQVKKAIGEPPDHDDPGDGRMMGFKKDGDTLYWIWTRTKNPALLVHEITHAVISALGDIGMTCDESSDEAYAYLAQYIFDKVLAIKK